MTTKTRTKTTRWRMAVGIAVTVLFPNIGFAQSLPPQHVAAQSATTETAARRRPTLSKAPATRKRRRCHACRSRVDARSVRRTRRRAWRSSSPLALRPACWARPGATTMRACGWRTAAAASFSLGSKPSATAAQPTTPPSAEPHEPIETWGEFSPGQGFLIGRGDAGELSISGYALVRYVNQTPGEQTFTDHLGNVRNVDGRNDIYSARVMIFFKGWLGTREAGLQPHPLDREHHGSAGPLCQYRLPVPPQVQPLCRPQRPSWHALAVRFASLLARPRSRDGRRVLPAVFRIRRLGARRADSRAVVQRHGGEQLERALASRQRSWTGSSRPAGRCGGCRRRRSSAHAAPTATGSGTRKWRPGSASPRRKAPSSASPTTSRMRPETPSSGWQTASTSSTSERWLPASPWSTWTTATCRSMPA